MKRQYTPDADEEMSDEPTERPSRCKKSRAQKFSADSTRGIDWHSVGIGHASLGNLDGVQHALQQTGNSIYHDCILAAAENGHSHIIDYILQLIPGKKYLYNSIAQGAAKGGQLHIMEYAIQMGGTIDYALFGASEADNVNLFKQLELRLPAQFLNQGTMHDICCKAAFRGSLDIIKYLDETDKVDFLYNFDEEILDSAISSGALDLVKYLMGYQLNSQLEIAASSGRRNVLDYLLSTCIPSKRIITNIGVAATYGNQKEIMIWALQQGASKERILEAIEDGGEIHLIPVVHEN